MFERYTDRARRSVVLAQEEARMMSHAEVDSGHLLIGLAAEDGGVASVALDGLGVKPDEARVVMAKLVPAAAHPVAGHMPFTRRLKRDTEGALREALAMGHNYIGTEHLLLGLIRVSDGSCAQVLDALGIPLPAVREKVIELLHGYAAAEKAGAAPRVTYPVPLSLRDVMVALEGISGRLDDIERHLRADAEGTDGT